MRRAASPPQLILLLNSYRLAADERSGDFLIDAGQVDRPTLVHLVGGHRVDNGDNYFVL